MKTLKAVLAAVAALAATLAGLDLTGIIAVMPAEWAKVLVVVPSAAAVIAHVVQALRKAIEAEDAKFQCHPVAVILAVLLVLLCPSCTVVTTTTTAPDGTVTVTKTEGVDAATVKAISDTAGAFAPPRARIVVDAGGK